MLVFNQWDWHVGKGDVVVECVGLFNNYSLVIGSGEICCYYTTWHSWLVNDASFFGVVVLGESTSNKEPLPK